LKHSSNKRRLQRTKRFARDIKKLSYSVQQEAFAVAQKLSEDIFNPELNIRKLSGFKDIYRVVVMKDYRMIYSYDLDSVYLLRIDHRKNIYRNLEI